MDHAIVFLPELLLLILAVALGSLGRVSPKLVAPVSTFGLLAVLGVLLGQGATGAVGGQAFAAAIQVGPFAWLFRAAILVGGAAASALAWGESPRRPGLFFGLLVASVFGAMAVASASDLVILTLGLAILGSSLIGLVALGARRAAREASMKLFFAQAIALALLLFAITWVFGLGGSTSYTSLGAALQTPDTLYAYALLLTLGGMAFTVAVLPFHAWLPDAVEASAPSVGAWMLGGAALAVVGALVRLLLMVFDTSPGLWVAIAGGLGVLCLVGGSLLALAQANLQRMVAFGAVASLGFILLALMATSHPAVSHEALRTLALTALAAGASMVGLLAGFGACRAERLEDLSGLAKRSPFLAFALATAALGLAGLPLAAAFWARVALVKAMLLYVSQSLQFAAVSLAVLVMLATVVLAYVFLRIPRAMVLGATDAGEGAEVAAPHGVVLVVATLLGFALFWVPGPFWTLASAAARGF